MTNFLLDLALHHAGQASVILAVSLSSVVIFVAAGGFPKGGDGMVA